MLNVFLKKLFKQISVTQGRIENGTNLWHWTAFTSTAFLTLIKHCLASEIWPLNMIIFEPANLTSSPAIDFLQEESAICKLGGGWLVQSGMRKRAFNATVRECNHLMQELENILSWKCVIKTLYLATDHVNISRDSLSSYARDVSSDRHCLVLKCQPCNFDACLLLL